MRMWVLFVVAGVVVFSGCSSNQVGCTVDNCHAMLNSCRVAFDGPSPRCLINTENTSSADAGSAQLDGYCVQSCTLQDNGGALAACIARKADTCIPGDDAVAVVCREETKSNAALPLESCRATCAATRSSCDDACTGGAACSSCLDSGSGDCASVCPAANRTQCLECSMGCYRTYLECSDACPRA